MNKATTTSLSFLHPSVHQQNCSNKYANRSFVFLIFCHCLLWQQPLPWSQQEKRTYWTRKKIWQPANSITKTQLVKKTGTQVMWLLLLTAQMLGETKDPSWQRWHINTISTQLNIGTYWQLSRKKKGKDIIWLFAKLAGSLGKCFQQASALGTSLLQGVILFMFPPFLLRLWASI